MAIDFHALLRRDDVRAALGSDKLSKALQNEDFLWDTICEDGNDVLTLAWDGNFPGGSGANYIREWNGLYFFSSSDHEEEGPFESLEGVLALDYFHLPSTPQPELDSPILPLERLLELARDLVSSEGDQILLNKKRFVLSGGKLKDMNGALISDESAPALRTLLFL